MARKQAWYRAMGMPSVALSVIIVGCSTPFSERATEELRQSVIDSSERELRHAAREPGPRDLQRVPSDLSLAPERMAELEKMAGLRSYPSDVEMTGHDLFGGSHELGTGVRVSLQQAIASAVGNNLTLQAARLDPAIRQAQVVAAQATFDWVFFADFEWNITDRPSVVPVINGVPVGAAAQTNQSVAYTTGIRKPLTSGGQFTASQGQTYLDQTERVTSFSPDPSNAAFASFRYDQPLLRGFGSDVALSEIRLALNVERDAIEALRTTLLDVINETEGAYWELVRARHSLQIQQRLLQRGIETRDVLESRLGVDARPAEFSDAVARVEQRRANVIRAENAIRQASDRLKQLMNDPELNVGSEVLLAPIDDPIEAPIRFSLLESMSAALAMRPELQRSILAIDSASIRQVVARNMRLPLLNFSVEAMLLGLSDDIGEAYEDVAESRFLNWLMSLAFEQPLGNRAAEANYRQRQLERLGATIRYREAVQQVVLEVKATLRNIDTNYRLIEQTRSARLAAAENLRTLLVLEETIASLSPDFLDLKFRRQDALAVAELEELRALVDYNTSLADLSRATGEALERNGIRFIVPDAGDFIGPDDR
jgi:outer membrane protein TolC